MKQLGQFKVMSEILKQEVDRTRNEMGRVQRESRIWQERLIQLY